MTELVARLRIAAQTEGAEGVRALSKELQSLAAQGGEAAPKFKALADEIDKLAGQQALVERFSALKRETAGLERSLEQAGGKVDGLAGELAAAGAKAAGFAQAQAQAAAALEAAKQKHAELKQSVAGAAQELAQLRASAKASGDATGAYAQQIEAAKTSLAGLKEQGKAAGAEVAKLATDHKAAAASLKEARQAEAALGKEYAGAVGNAKALSGALGAKRQALDETRASLKQAGVETANLATHQAALKNALAATVTQAQQEAAALRAASETSARLAAQAQQAGAGLQQAFGAVGLRSAEAIRQEIADVERALQRIAAEAKVTGPEFDRVWAAGQQRIAALKGELAGVPPHLDGIKSKGDGVIATLKGMAGAFLGIQTAQQFLQANVELEQLRRGLVAVTGSAGSADAELGRLRERANLLGVEVGTLGRNYISLAAVTRGTVLEGQATREVFDAVAGAMGSLGKGGVETERALQAVSQMASKGTVAMEELRGQLGEALPGALAASAKGLGITKQELIQLVESGNLLAEDFLPALASGLKQTFGDGKQQVQGFAAEWQRLKNTISEVATDIGSSGMMTALANGAKLAGGAINDLWVEFELLGKVVGITAGFLAEVWKNPRAAWAEYKKDIAEAATEAANKLGALNKAAGEVADSSAQAATAGAQAGQQMAAAAPQIGQAATALQGVATAGAQAAQGATAAGQAASQAGSQAQQSATGWVAVNNAYSQVTAGAQAYTAGALKAAEAKKAEGEASVKMAELSGNEIKVLEARAAAAQADAVASQNVAKARQTEVSILQSQLVALQEEGKARGGLTEAKQQQLDKLQQLIAARQTEAEKATQAAAALNAEAEAAQRAATGVEAAFQRLGVASSASLQQAADNARRDFDLIASSGKATAADLTQAFASYAEKAIAANGGVATESLKVKGAMRGVAIQTDSAGRTTVTAMTDAAEAIKLLGTDADATAAKVGNIGKEAEQAGEKFALIQRQAEFGRDAEGNLLPDPADRTSGPTGGSGGGGGGGQAISGYTERGAYEHAKQAGLSEAQALKLAGEYMDRWRLQPFGLSKFEEAIDAAVLVNAKASAKKADRSEAPTVPHESPAAPPPPSPAPAPAPQRYEVAITVGGRRETINTASQADAGNLVELLQRLESDMQRAH